MTTFNINGIIVHFINVDDPTQHEAERYIRLIHKQTSYPPRFVTVTGSDDDHINLDFELNMPKFERIRRITGYLTGTLDSWNNSKRAEERDRVKHDITDDIHEKNTD